MMAIGWILVVLYALCLLFILFYSIGQFALTKMGRNLSDSQSANVQSLKKEELPFFTVQLPVFNEKYVVEKAD